MLAVDDKALPDQIIGAMYGITVMNFGEHRT
jgi:hypothetical protein